jgi:hypothetical protein
LGPDWKGWERLIRRCALLNLLILFPGESWERFIRESTLLNLLLFFRRKRGERPILLGRDGIGALSGRNRRRGVFPE